MTCPFDGHNCPQRKIFHVTNIDGNKIEEIHLCAECPYDPFEEGEVDKLIDKVIKEGVLPKLITIQTDKCTCGLTLQELIGGVRLGCANCYNTFRNVLVPIMESVQAGSKHIGKVPKNNIEWLKKRLVSLIKEEKYEEAAIISAKIKSFSNTP